jgi:hypothetical protein
VIDVQTMVCRRPRNAPPQSKLALAADAFIAAPIKSLTY